MNSIVWLVWVFCGAALALGARHPLYAILLFGIGRVTAELALGQQVTRSPRTVLILPIAGAIFNGLSAHVGDTVLFRIPEEVPLAGGPVTAEALAYGAVAGLAFAVLIEWFGVFVARVPAYGLARLAPRSFHAIALVVTLALGLAPSTHRRLREIRAAQATRGYRPRGALDWLPLWIPLLVGGLEQSSQLAEAMLARGYAAAPRALRRRDLGLVVVGLGFAISGGYVELATGSSAGVAVMIAGAATFGAGLFLSGRAATRSSYRGREFEALDLGILTIIVASTSALLLTSPGSLIWDPYPTLSAPSFDLVTGATMLVLLAPGIGEAFASPEAKKARYR